LQDTLYNSINNIPIVVFYDILKTNDLSLLGKHDKPEDVWIDIYDEYCIASNIDNSNLKTIVKVDGLKKKYEFIIGALEILRHSYYLLEYDGYKEIFKMAGDTLRSKGYLFNEAKVFEEEFERLRVQTESLSMKISIEEDKIEKTDKKLAINIWKELVGLERITGVKIDPKTDPIAKLIEVRLLGNEIISKQQAA
tara:strand:+ start:8727 stop:9311 length:585 start_codon:yes stop_codon:yes gene_type:complete